MHYHSEQLKRGKMRLILDVFQHFLKEEEEESGVHELQTKFNQDYLKENIKYSINLSESTHTK